MLTLAYVHKNASIVKSTVGGVDKFFSSIPVLYDIIAFYLRVYGRGKNDSIFIQVRQKYLTKCCD